MLEVEANRQQPVGGSRKPAGESQQVEDGCQQEEGGVGGGGGRGGVGGVNGVEWSDAHTHPAVLKTVPHCKQFSSSRSLRHTSRTPAMQPPWRMRSASQASHESALKREPQSGGEGDMRPQKKRRGDQAPLDYKGMTWCIYLWGQKPKIITDALVLGESQLARSS